MQTVMRICNNSDWVNMDSQSSNAIEVPDEITCYQDEQFVDEITSVNDLYFANQNLLSPLLTSPDDDSDRDEILAMVMETVPT